MAASTGISGKGTQLGYCDTSNGTYTFIGQLSETNIPKVSVGSAEATTYLSDNGYEEVISTGWKKTEPLTGKLTYHETITSTLFGLLDTAKYWQVLTTDGSKWIVYGRLTEIGGDAIPLKDMIKLSIVITPSGQTTFTVV